jgi:hypothetical protein
MAIVTARASYFETGLEILADLGLGKLKLAEVCGRLGVTTILVHTSGGRVATGPLPMPAPNDPQKVGSAITYARRYALMATLGLAAEDDDGQAAKPAPSRPAAPKGRPDSGYDLKRRDGAAPSPASVALFERIKATKGTPVADVLKGLAAEAGLKLTVEAIDSDPKFAEQLNAILKENT